MELGEVIVYVESGCNLCKSVGLSFHQFRNVCSINEYLRSYRPYCLDAAENVCKQTGNSSIFTITAS